MLDRLVADKDTERAHALSGASERGISWSSGARFPRVVGRVGTEDGNQEGSARDGWGASGSALESTAQVGWAVARKAVRPDVKRRTPAILAGSLPPSRFYGGG